MAPAGRVLAKCSPAAFQLQIAVDGFAYGIDCRACAESCEDCITGLGASPPYAHLRSISGAQPANALPRDGQGETEPEAVARVDPTLISFRLPREVVREIEGRSDCPPSAGAGRLGGPSLWIRRLVLSELGLDPDIGTDEAREKSVDEFLRAVTAYWRVKRIVADLQAEPDKRAHSWSSKIRRAEKQLTEAESRLESFARMPGHELGCDCQPCQQVAGTSRA